MSTAHAPREAATKSRKALCEAWSNAIGDKLDVLFDSGIRTVAEIARAIALGAKMVFAGGPYMYGLVTRVLRALCDDLGLTLHLFGLVSVSKRQHNRSVLVREDGLQHESQTK